MMASLRLVERLKVGLIGLAVWMAGADAIYFSQLCWRLSLVLVWMCGYAHGRNIEGARLYLVWMN